MSRNEDLVRWRLILGAPSAEALDRACGATADDLASDAALAWLYDRDTSNEERDIRQGGPGPSQLTVPEWINEIHRLFPKETIERLERDAVEEFEIHEVVTNPDVLSRMEPNETLLRAVLQTKHLMNQDVLAMARELVRKVVRELMEKLAKEVRQTLSGTRNRRRSLRKRAYDFDPRGTIRRNLSTYDKTEKRLFIKVPLFLSRSKRHNERWQVILLVDESGSMLSSVIHAAVTAACLWGLPSLKTSLAIFDTEVVDLTSQIQDPVETLMKVQLGGGTDIARAVQYGETLVENPRRTIVVLITDLFEGGDADALVRSTKRLCEQGVRFLVLAALDQNAQPTYDRDLGRRLVNVGAHVGAMTPGELVGYLKGIIA
ncbi:Mg-chelatase subunit ChlD [Labilithrix luteola]|uniref:Mg-chelatase subunit ChlD n=1 Tax=Labilithrix luteola TaxID=1391654 RepID=A0A0K1QGC5_9BACT|nr:VWA domain-containing protein [Labilithrix luteola]AKV04768.1 Mg-chelatase subunit ChlD [Labilithrix luteola]